MGTQFKGTKHRMGTQLTLFQSKTASIPTFLPTGSSAGAFPLLLLSLAVACVEACVEEHPVGFDS